MSIVPVQNLDDWHALRAKHIGASEVSALFGCAPDYAQSAYSLWQIKSGRIPAPAVDGLRIEAGRRLERAIGQWIADIEGWKVEPMEGYAVSDTVPGLGCTPDFRIVDHADGPGLLEVKSVDWLQHKRAWGDEPPVHIEIQLQCQMLVTGCKWGAVGVLVGGNDPKVYRFEYREKIGKEIERRVAAFWQSVADAKEPPVDGSSATAAAIAEMFPEAKPGASIDLDGDNEFPGRWAALVQARADRNAAEKTETANKNWLMAKVGDAELIRYGGQIIATAKVTKRKGYAVEPSSSRVLRIKDAG